MFVASFVKVSKEISRHAKYVLTDGQRTDGRKTQCLSPMAEHKNKKNENQSYLATIKSE